MEIKASVDVIDFVPGDKLKIRWNFWDKQANHGEGGYLFNEIILEQPPGSGYPTDGRMHMTFNGMKPTRCS